MVMRPCLIPVRRRRAKNPVLPSAAKPAGSHQPLAPAMRLCLIPVRRRCAQNSVLPTAEKPAGSRSQPAPARRGGEALLEGHADDRPHGPDGLARERRHEDLRRPNRHSGTVMGPGKATAAPKWPGRGGARDSDGTDARDDKSRGAEIARSRPDSVVPLEHRLSAARYATRTPPGGPIARNSLTVQPHTDNSQLPAP
jgi:hypothetical protein